MTRRERNRLAKTPVSRNLIGASPSTGFNLTSPHAPVVLSGQRVKKGVVRNHHRVNTWDTTSPNYSTSATIDRSWDRTVSDGV